MQHTCAPEKATCGDSFPSRGQRHGLGTGHRLHNYDEEHAERTDWQKADYYPFTDAGKKHLWEKALHPETRL